MNDPARGDYATRRVEQIRSQQPKEVVRLASNEESEWRDARDAYNAVKDDNGTPQKTKDRLKARMDAIKASKPGVGSGWGILG